MTFQIKSITQSARSFMKFSLITTALLTLSACQSGGKDNVEIEGVDGPNIGVGDEKVLITTTFENITLDGEVYLPLPEYEESELYIKNTDNGAEFKLEIAVDDVLGDLPDVKDLRLPGGRALPGVSEGSLPGVAFTVEKFHNTRVYVGEDFFGIFYPKEMDLGGGIVTSKYYMGDERVGNISLVGDDENGENGGVLLLIQKDETVKKFLKSLKRSRRPHR